MLGVVDQDYQVISDVTKNTALENFRNYREERNGAVVFNLIFFFFLSPQLTDLLNSLVSEAAIWQFLSKV